MARPTAESSESVANTRSPSHDPPPAIASLIEATGRTLQDGVRSAFPTSIASAPLRDAAAQLKLERGLAWKLQRIMNAEDELHAVHESPSVPGLRKLLASAETAGASETACDKLSTAVAAFERLLASFPDGRHGLRAALASHVPEAKHAADRDARRAVVQGSAHLRGFGADSVYNATILFQDSSDPTQVSRARTAAIFGFRRLREGPNFRLIATVTSPIDTPGHPDALHVTLEGTPSRAVADYVMDEFTTPGVTKLQMIQDGERCYLACPPGVPEINTPENIVVAQRAGRLGERYAREGLNNEYFAYVNRLPCNLSCLDMLIHKDIYPAADPPGITHTMVSDVDLRHIPDGPEEIHEPIDQPGEMRSLGRGLVQAESADIPLAKRILETTFERLGHDPDDYRLYRYRQTYPVVQCAGIWWYPLPSPPEA